MGASGGAGGSCITPADEFTCVCFHARSRELTLTAEISSASVVRVSTVEISMRWSAGLTRGGHGKPS